jgi:hypothetical protein
MIRAVTPVRAPAAAWRLQVADEASICRFERMSQ